MANGHSKRHYAEQFTWIDKSQSANGRSTTNEMRGKNVAHLKTSNFFYWTKIIGQLKNSVRMRAYFGSKCVAPVIWTSNNSFHRYCWWIEDALQRCRMRWETNEIIEYFYNSKFICVRVVDCSMFTTIALNLREAVFIGSINSIFLSILRNITCD